MFDIGGGSSELAWLDFRGGRPRRQGRMAASIRSWQSLPVGVVSIAEQFGGVDVTPETFEAMVAYVAEHLREFRGRDKLRQMIAEHPVHLIGTSGTVTTLAGLHLGLERYERQKVDGLWMTRGRSRRDHERRCSPCRSTGASRIPASAATAPIWCCPAAPSSRPSAANGRPSACASPIAACARAF